MIDAMKRTGRLIEVRFASPITSDELAAFDAWRRRTMARTPPASALVCMDCRDVEVMAPEHTAHLVSLLRLHTAPVLRAGFLVSPEKATVALQIERIIRESHSPARRVFRDPGALLGYLGEVGTQEEMLRCQEFLAGTS